MGVVAVLRTERGEQVRALDDPNGGSFDGAGDFDEVLTKVDDSYRLLRYVDPYGDTVFNRPQMPDVLADIERLSTIAASSAASRGLARLQALANGVETGPTCTCGSSGTRHPVGAVSAARFRHHARMASVPAELRTPIFAQLQALVRGDQPELLTWVRQYKGTGAALVTQPMKIWTHPNTTVTPIEGGGWHIVVPLWTSDESPSDLSAEVSVTPDGHVRITDVHVL